MRLGGPIPQTTRSPEEWIEAHTRAGYTAAYWPGVPEEAIDAYIVAAKRANLVIAEVGAWSNPMSRDPSEREKAIAHCTRQLALAERIGARCCVNIAGSYADKWDGPHPDNLTEAAFDQIVETTRRIIDAVKPNRAFYTLEPMPWMYPDSPASYLKLLKAIGRKAFAVHLDPVNWINSPTLYFRNGDFIRECFTALGPFIQSCHAKDVTLQEKLTVHLDECRPGTGALDYAMFLIQLSKLGPGIPLMLEHLPNTEEYTLAAQHIRSVAGQIGVDIQ